MSIDATLAKKTYDRIDTDNKIELESGTYNAVIKDVWIYYVDVDGRFTKNRNDATEQKVKFTIVLDETNPPVALAMELPIRISKNTFYSKVIEKLTGIADREQHLTFDPKTLVGKEIFATIEFAWNRRKKAPYDEYPWSKVTEIAPREVVVKKPQPVQRTGALPASLGGTQPSPRDPAADAGSGYFSNDDEGFDPDEIPF